MHYYHCLTLSPLELMTIIVANFHRRDLCSVVKGRIGSEIIVPCRTTSPESCALEFYVRSGRHSRFQRLGPPFLHSPAATSFLDVQVNSEPCSTG